MFDKWFALKLKARLLDIQAGRSIVVLNPDTASSLGLHSSDRVRITYKDVELIAILDTGGDFPVDQIGLFEELSRKLAITGGVDLNVEPAQAPEAMTYVQAKIRGQRLREKELEAVVDDVVTGHLSDIELASFVTALHVYGLNMNEVEALSKAMVKTGTTLNLDKKPILDKHSIGGIPGDKASILVVPIVAAAGFTIPKTSSRAVTSAAGTADRVEVLCPVNLAAEEIRRVVRKTNGCLAWGGALDLAPADDILIRIEYPLGIDPLLLPSIMSKKKAIGATHVIIDIPTGNGAKIKTIGEAYTLANDFIDLGKRLNMSIQCAITYGEQPLGYAIGPALEAKEALSSIIGKGSWDLREKATSLAGMLFEMMGIKNGKQKAEAILKSGKAEAKLRQIIEAQGGNPKIKAVDVKIGDRRSGVVAKSEGRILSISNSDIAKIAREAGAPREKGAGILLKAKLGDRLSKGDTLFEIYAERSTKLQAALELAYKLQPVSLSRKPESRILLDRVPGKISPKKSLALDR